MENSDAGFLLPRVHTFTEGRDIGGAALFDHLGCFCGLKESTLRGRMVENTFPHTSFSE